jgi:hypothetical protein
MNDINHSNAWISFTYLNAVMSLGLTLGAVVFLPVDLWIKGYLVMGISMVTSSTVILTKTMRDRQETTKLVNKIEEAKTERLLAGLQT